MPPRVGARKVVPPIKRAQRRPVPGGARVGFGVNRVADGVDEVAEERVLLVGVAVAAMIGEGPRVETVN